MKAKDVLDNPEEEIDRLCTIEVDDLDACLREHAQRYGRAYRWFMEAIAEENEQRWTYERTKTQAFKSLRDEGVAVTQAKEQANIEENVQDEYQKLLKMERRTGIFRSLMNALEHRRDMLIQLSSREKREQY